MEVVQPKKRKRKESKKEKKDETEVNRNRIKGRIKAAARRFPAHLDTLGVSDVPTNREHDSLLRIQTSDPEEISSGSDAFLQGRGGSSRIAYNLGKRDPAAGNSEERAWYRSALH